jgi:hypothetical protein
VAEVQRPRVLVEGDSDALALTVLGARLGVTVSPVVMHGVTNLRTHLAADPHHPALLLHDRRETAYVERVLARTGAEVTTAVCDADLEDELIRAVGVPGMLAVVDAQGERAAYERMAQQPAQRDRTDHQRLHRWLGARSGHKRTYAGLLAGAVPLEAAPAPLLDLLAAVARQA